MRGLDHFLEDQHRIRCGFTHEEYWGDNYLNASPPSIRDMEEFFAYDEDMAIMAKNAKQVTWQDGDMLHSVATGDAGIALQTCTVYGCTVVRILPDGPNAPERIEHWGFGTFLTEKEQEAEEKKARRWENDEDWGF